MGKTATMIVVKHSEAVKWKSGGSARYSDGVYKVDAKAEFGNEVRFSVSEGSVIAYDMAKCNWSGTLTRQPPLQSLSLDVYGI